MDYKAYKPKFDAAQLLAQLDEHRKKVLEKKALEYTTNGDRIWSFKQGARFYFELTGKMMPPEDYCVALLTKHLACIDDMICGRTTNISRERIFEKFGDALNYLELLKMMCSKIIANHCSFSLVALDEKLKSDYLVLMDRLEW